MWSFHGVESNLHVDFMYATGNSEPRHGIFFSNRFVTQLYVRKWKLGTKSEFPVFHEV